MVPFSVNMRNATVEDILQAAFRGKSLTYTYVEMVFLLFVRCMCLEKIL